MSKGNDINIKIYSKLNEYILSNTEIANDKINELLSLK